MVKKGGKSKKSNKLESLKAAIEEEENQPDENAVAEDTPKPVKKRKGKFHFLFYYKLKIQGVPQNFSNIFHFSAVSSVATIIVSQLV